MAEATVRVKGFREFRRALRAVDTGADRSFREGLRAVAETVRVDAAGRFSSRDAKTAAGFKVRVRARGVNVEQTLRKTTGLHPEFGALQMRTALLPALDAHDHELMEGVERELDRLVARQGF